MHPTASFPIRRPTSRAGRLDDVKPKPMQNALHEGRSLYPDPRLGHPPRHQPAQPGLAHGDPPGLTAEEQAWLNQAAKNGAEF